MSELKLSTRLIETLRRQVIDHDAQAKNPGVCAQYLAAAIGCLIADMSINHKEKHEVLASLHHFMQHIVDDLQRQQPSATEAYGVWRPGQA